MIDFVTYDPNDGHITGRFSVSEGQEKNYKNKVPISQEEYEAQPEITMKVDVSSKTLINKAEVNLSTDKTNVQRNENVTVTCTGLVAAGKLTGDAGEMVDVTPANPSAIMSTNQLGEYHLRFVNDINQYSTDVITLTVS